MKTDADQVADLEATAERLLATRPDMAHIHGHLRPILIGFLKVLAGDVQAEREACAALADSFQSSGMGGWWVANNIASAIRARGPGLTLTTDAVQAEVQHLRADIAEMRRREAAQAAEANAAAERHHVALTRMRESADIAYGWNATFRAVLARIVREGGTPAATIAREALLDELPAGAARRHGGTLEVQP